MIVAQRLCALLERAPAGVHRLQSPATVLDSAWPQSVADIYRAFDGAELFHGDISVFPSRGVHQVDGLTVIAKLWEEDIAIDSAGQVRRHDDDRDEWLSEATVFDRWLWGVCEGLELLFDDDGEYSEAAFTEAGELSVDMRRRIEQAILKREPKAPAPRWRLAQALRALGEYERARDELELAVTNGAGFSWAWFELARVSERLGDVETSIDEYEAAARANPDHAHNSLFWAHAARVAAACSLPERRADFAARALEKSQVVVKQFFDAALELLAAGTHAAAREYASLALALRPGDLQVLALLSRLDAEDDSVD